MHHILFFFQLLDRFYFLFADSFISRLCSNHSDLTNASNVVAFICVTWPSLRPSEAARTRFVISSSPPCRLESSQWALVVCMKSSENNARLSSTFSAAVIRSFAIPVRTFLDWLFFSLGFRWNKRFSAARNVGVWLRSWHFSLGGRGS